MVRKIYSYVIFLFTFFVFVVLTINIWLYQKEITTLNTITTSYQYNFIINKMIYDKIFLLKHTLNKYYKELLKNEKKKQIEILQNDLNKLSTILKTLQNVGFKNYESFLFKYIFNIYNEDIEIIKENKILISKKLDKIGKTAFIPCNPFENYGQCITQKADKIYIVQYSPAYKLIIESDFKLSELKNSSILNNILTMLTTIPNIIVYTKDKQITGKFEKDKFYIFDEFKPLKIFFGFGVKYKEIETLSCKINKEILKAIKPFIFLFIALYILLILTIYFILFTLFRKKITLIEKILQDYSLKAIHDKLTGVYNRHGFELMYNKTDCKYFLIIDLDNFKYINDTFGHKIGDFVLKEFSGLLKKHFKDGLIGRWGGDEFLICTNKEKNQIKQSIEHINKELKKIQREFDNKPVKTLSTSAGVCEDSTLDMQKRFNNADLALYKVKKTKKGNVIFYKDVDYIKIEKEDIKK